VDGVGSCNVLRNPSLS